VIRRPKIVSEFSAQRRSHPRNPALNKAVAVLRELRAGRNLGSVADVGCGKLRHYGIFAELSTTLFLVDTKTQMGTTHRDRSRSYTIPDVAASARQNRRAVYAVTFEEFSAMRAQIDVAFAVAVFDVVTRENRREIIHSVSHALRREGYFVVIIPRNDSTITRRCLRDNRYKDGHVFTHHGLQTFFCNFATYRSVINDCAHVGCELRLDLSTYRQVCLIFYKRR
jgi:SAM-dependent methyltransferase